MTSTEDQAARAVLLDLFDTAVRSADPAAAVLEHLPEKPRGRCVVVGSGKATAAMAAAVDNAWPDVKLTGIVSTRYGHAVPAGRIRVIEASHPVPDENSLLSAELMLEAVAGLGPDDLVLCLMSGGASALASSPVSGVTLEEKRAINHQLLISGAPIEEMNAVRQSLSRIKGGRLAAAAGPAKVVTLVVSDVPGDDPAVVGSGPTIPRSGATSLAMQAIARRGLYLPQHILDAIARSTLPGPPRPQDRHVVIASARKALIAAAAKAQSLGYTPMVLGDSIEGESSQVGTLLATIAESAALSGMPVQGSAVILSGGETTVTVRDVAGCGGRNMETLLAAAIRLRGRANIWALAADTDGIDGTDVAAGAIVTPDTLRRADAMGIDPQQCLADHDSGSFFRSLGDTVETGPTLTNVNDFRVFLIG